MPAFEEYVDVKYLKMRKSCLISDFLIRSYPGLWKKIDWRFFVGNSKYRKQCTSSLRIKLPKMGCSILIWWLSLFLQRLKRESCWWNEAPYLINEESNWWAPSKEVLAVFRGWCYKKYVAIKNGYYSITISKQELETGARSGKGLGVNWKMIF